MGELVSQAEERIRAGEEEGRPFVNPIKPRVLEWRS
jgi:hypothetical protein